MRTELRIVGLGGQGVILSGYIIGKAAAVFDGKHASLIQAYGPEARGSACHASLVVSDREIDYPQVTSPDILAVLSQEGYSTFAGELKSGGVMLIDSGLVHTDGRPRLRRTTRPVGSRCFRFTSGSVPRCPRTITLLFCRFTAH